MFAALADATRRDIVVRAIAGEKTISELADGYNMSWAAVQKHVAVLDRAGLVTKERRGRSRVIHCNRDVVQRARDLLDAVDAQWRDRATRISELLEEEEER